jgi:hypothetical protein
VARHDRDGRIAAARCRTGLASGAWAHGGGDQRRFAGWGGGHGWTPGPRRRWFPRNSRICSSWGYLSRIPVPPRYLSLPRRRQLDFFLSHPLLLFWFSNRNRERARRGVQRSSGTDRLQAVYHTNSCARRDSREERRRPPVAFVISIPGAMGMLSLNRLMLKQERRRRRRIQARSKPPLLGRLDLSVIRLCLCAWPQLTYVTCYAYFWVHGPMGRASIAIPLYFFIKKKINFLWCLLCFGVYTMFFLEEEQKKYLLFYEGANWYIWTSLPSVCLTSNRQRLLLFPISCGLGLWALEGATILFFFGQMWICSLQNNTWAGDFERWKYLPSM